MFNLALGIIDKGWAQIQISNDDKEIIMFASRLSDSFSGLIGAMLKLFRGIDEVCFSFEEEPGQYRWLINKVGTIINVRILWFEKTFSKIENSKGKEVLFFKQDLLQFARLIIISFDKLLFEYGADEYKRIWTYDFPSNMLEELRSVYKLQKSDKN